MDGATTQSADAKVDGRTNVVADAPVRTDGAGTAGAPAVDAPQSPPVDVAAQPVADSAVPGFDVAQLPVDSAPAVGECKDGAEVVCTRDLEGICYSGKRTCTGGKVGECVPASSSTTVNSCGPGCVACDGNRANACAGGKCVCGAGALCAAGSRCCGAAGGATCIDVTNDVNNCGTCGAKCTGQFNRCAGGSCACGVHVGACAAGTTCCGGATGNCFDTKTDKLHCGACGHSCLGSPCAAGVCQAAAVSGAEAAPFTSPAANSTLTHKGETYSLGFPRRADNAQVPGIKKSDGTIVCQWDNYLGANEEASVYGMVTDGTDIYVLIVGGPIGVFSCPLSGGAVREIQQTTGSPEGGLVLTATALYWKLSSANAAAQVYRWVK